jgi:hypothetical protein
MSLKSAIVLQETCDERNTQATGNSQIYLLVSQPHTHDGNKSHGD